MNKLCKILMSLILITSFASFHTVFSMDENTTMNTADDHGNNIGLPTKLEIGFEQEGVIDYSGDYDCFIYTAETSGMYSFESTGAARLEAEFNNNRKGIIGYNYDSGIDKNFYYTVWINANENVYIKATSKNINIPYKVKVCSLNDDHGYDTSSATELVLDGEVKGELNFTCDNDFFKFTPSVSGPYAIESTGTTDLAAYLSDCGYSESYTCGYNADISATDKNFKYSYTLSAGKTYFLQVYHNTIRDKDYEAESIGAYGIKVSMLTDDYANTYNRATEIKLGDEIQAVQESGKDFDCFKFVPDTSGIYGIESAGITDTKVSVFNSDLAIIDSDDNSGIGNNFYSAVQMNANETYYINACSNDLDVPYKITINPLIDDYGDENDSATEVFLDNEVEGKINHPKDTDCFKFTPSITQQYVIESNGNANVSGILYKYASSNDISNTYKNFRITYTLKANETYYIQVYLNGKDKDYQTEGDYSLRIKIDSDDYGNSYDEATEIKVGEEIQVIQECSEDCDYFMFTPKSSGMYSLESTGNAETTVVVYNSEQKMISNDTYSGIDLNFYIALFLNANETYYFKTSSSDRILPSYSYNIKLSMLTDDHGHDQDSAIELVLDKEVAGEINFTKDIDYFKFTPTTSQIYFIESTGNTDVQGYLCDHKGNFDKSVEDLNFGIKYTLEANKTYYIKVYHARDDKDYAPTTGAYGIKITAMSDDHGNSFDMATNIFDGDELQAMTESDSDYEYFKFIPATSSMYCFESTGSNQTRCELFKDNISINQSYGGGLGDNFYFPVWLEANHVYYLKTWSTKKNIPYYVKVYSVEDDHGYDNASATQLDIGDEITGNINFSNDSDYFKITVDEGGPYLIESSGSTEIKGNLGSVKGVGIDNYVNFRIAYSLEANNTYYLTVMHKNYRDKEYQNTGEYKIKFTRLKDDFGDSFDTALLVDTGKVINGRMQSANDTDYVKFIPTETSSYTIEKFENSNLRVHVFDENYQSVATESIYGNNGNYKYVCNLEEGKTYYMILDDVTDSCVDYQFVIYRGREGNLSSKYFYYSDLQIGVKTTGTINYYGDVDYYRIYSKTSAIYEIESCGNDIYCEVYDGSGYNLLSADNIVDNDESFNMKIELVSSKYYFIKVGHKDSKSDLDDYTIKVTDMTAVGDLNRDGTFNSIDFGYMRMYLLGLKKDFTYEELKVGDVDGNGSVNSVDFAIMRHVLIGMRDGF